MSEQISITRALTELKTLDTRIRQRANQLMVSYEIDNRLAGGKDKAVFAKEAKESLQSFHDLVNRRNKIKRAIVLSNARTEVKVGDETYTVAEAIERKNSIQYEKMMLDSLRSQLRSANAQIEANNLKASNALDSILEKAVAVDSGNAANVVEQITQSYREKNFAKLVDPVDAEKKIAALQTSIEDFERNVDFALSEINAVTKIEV